MRHLSMLMDFYELTMANGYFLSDKKDEEVVFDLFYRHNPDDGGFAIAAGLQQVIEYIQNLHFNELDLEYLRAKNMFDEQFLEYLKNFRCSLTIEAVPEGTIVYPNTPILTVSGKLIEAQLIETMLLLTINHQSLIATKASRLVRASMGRSVLEFGARRAHGYDAAIYGARAAYIGGVSQTATALAEMEFQVPAVGTMAHSWIQLFDDEYKAFEAYANIYPKNCVLLVDTYDVLRSGIPNAIKVAKEVLSKHKAQLKGIRIDSGDLAYLSIEARKMLDSAGLVDTTIIVSNSVDEHLIQSLLSQGAEIDVFAVGERLITSSSEPVFGGVYKLVAVKKDGFYEPRIKISETIEKITTPGKKKLYRIFDCKTKKAIADYLTFDHEVLDCNKPLLLFDPSAPWKRKILDSYHAVQLQKPIFVEGKLVYKNPTLHEIRAYVDEQLKDQIYLEEQRFDNPHRHYVDLSEELYQCKTSMLGSIKQ